MERSQITTSPNLKDKVLYVDGKLAWRCTVVDHVAARPDLYVVLLDVGFWSADRDRFVRYLVVHKDNLAWAGV